MPFAKKQMRPGSQEGAIATPRAGETPRTARGVGEGEAGATTERSRASKEGRGEEGGVTRIEGGAGAGDSGRGGEGATKEERRERKERERGERKLAEVESREERRERKERGRQEKEDRARRRKSAQAAHTQPLRVEIDVLHAASTRRGVTAAGATQSIGAGGLAASPERYVGADSDTSRAMTARKLPMLHGDVTPLDSTYEWPLPPSH